jgi:hypothetical protein
MASNSSGFELVSFDQHRRLNIATHVDKNCTENFRLTLRIHSILYLNCQFGTILDLSINHNLVRIKWGLNSEMHAEMIATQPSVSFPEYRSIIPDEADLGEGIQHDVGTLLRACRDILLLSDKARSCFELTYVPKKLLLRLTCQNGAGTSCTEVLCNSNLLISVRLNIYLFMNALQLSRTKIATIHIATNRKLLVKSPRLSQVFMTLA